MNYMPWYAYKFMNDIDLKAIYVYLMSVAPIENDVLPNGGISSHWATDIFVDLSLNLLCKKTDNEK